MLVDDIDVKSLVAKSSFERATLCDMEIRSASMTKSKRVLNHVCDPCPFGPLILGNLNY